MLALLLSEKGFKWVRGRIFFGPPTLTRHSLEAPWAMKMNSSSFESPKTYLFALEIKNSRVALLRYTIIAQTYPIYVVLH